jgi:hypothetical protein
VIDLTLARLLHEDREREIAARHRLRAIRAAAESCTRDTFIPAPPKPAPSHPLRPASTSGLPR